MNSIWGNVYCIILSTMAFMLGYLLGSGKKSKVHRIDHKIHDREIVSRPAIKKKAKVIALSDEQLFMKEIEEKNSERY